VTVERAGRLACEALRRPAVGEAGALVLQAVREWLQTRTGKSVADYRSAQQLLARLRDQPGHQNLLSIRGELALDPDTGGFYLKTSNDRSSLLAAFLELGNQRQRNGEPYLVLLHRCQNPECRRKPWFLARRPDQTHCSGECRAAHHRSTPAGREKRKLYMRAYRETLKDHPKLQPRENQSRRRS
jgi:hypothetical protein